MFARTLLFISTLFALIYGGIAHADLKIDTISSFNEPWAMTFLPDGRLLVTEKGGSLYAVGQNGQVSKAIEGVPNVAYGGQGGLGDVILHPDYSDNGLIYLSYAESGRDNTYGAVVVRGQLDFDDSGAGYFTEPKVIWQQYPKVSGKGHYGHRMLFDQQGYLFISSGERQKFDPSQDMQSNLGKIVRLHDDGSIPQDNPFFDQGGVTAQIWSTGHRNPLGIAFDSAGRLWNSEMGPAHGDELNLVIRGKNYGYPIVSNGNHYNGDPIPNHSSKPEFEAPKTWWDKTIAPAGLLFYQGDMFPAWRESALIPGLRSKAIVRVKIEGDTASEVERIKMKRRIREVEQGPDGSLWVLEDGKGGKLLRLTN